MNLKSKRAIFRFPKDFKNQVCILTAGAIHHINKEVFNKLMGGITINF